jgi:hypothetical protein
MGLEVALGYGYDCLGREPIIGPQKIYFSTLGNKNGHRILCGHKVLLLFTFSRLYSHPIDKASGLRCDQTIVLTGVHSCADYPTQLRRIKFYDATHDKLLVFLTNHFDLRADRLRALPLPVAGRAVLQMDQTAPAHQGFLWHFRERGQNPSLDRHRGLCAGGRCQETPESRCLALYDPTDFEPDALREDASRSSACQHRTGGRNREKQRPVEIYSHDLRTLLIYFIKASESTVFTYPH